MSYFCEGSLLNSQFFKMILWYWALQLSLLSISLPRYLYESVFEIILLPNFNGISGISVFLQENEYIFSFGLIYCYLIIVTPQMYWI